MKRLTVALAALVLLAGCSMSPAGPDQDLNTIPDGSLALKIGVEADIILQADPSTSLAAVVASAWSEQQGCDVECEAEYAASEVLEHNPEIIEITQTRLTPSAEAKPIPSGLEYPEFAPMLEDILQSMGCDYRIYESTVTVSTTVPMLVDGSEIDMKFTVTESVIALSTWVP